MTTFNLTGRNTVITGGARGMGAQFALDLAKAGANVLIVSIYDDVFARILFIINRHINRPSQPPRLRLSWKRYAKSIQQLWLVLFKLIRGVHISVLNIVSSDDSCK
jgi:hypothetical protein